MVKIRVQIHRANDEAAVVHLHTSGNNTKSFLLALAVGRAADRAVLTLHSGLLPGFLAQRRARRELARLALAPFQAILCVSAAQQQILERSGLRGLERIPSFIDGPLTPAPRWPDLVRLRREGQPLVAMACHPSPVYGTELALKAMEILHRSWPRAKLVLFGPGLGESTDAVASAGGVTWLGELPAARALAVIEAADLFLRPTRAEGDALSVREALALGVRCVASDTVLRPLGVVTFAATDAEACAQAMERALALPPPTPACEGSLRQILEVYRRVRPEAAAREGTWAATP
jgi:glycosyltransferase involved in cell wall biosynthesis